MSKVKIEGNASGTGTLTISAPNTNTDRTINLPDDDITLGGGVDGVDSDYTSGTAVKIDSSGNVGIGTDSPSAKLEVRPNAVIGNGTNGVKLTYSNGNSTGIIDTGFSSTGLEFRIQNSEKMRINSSGNVLFGCTSNPSATVPGSGFIKTSYDTELRMSTNITGGNSLVVFYNPNGQIGSIVSSGSSTSYNTTSDYRLKENVVDMTNAIDRVKALQPRRFNFIADADTTVDGFLAHEVSDVIPEAISGEKDATKKKNMK